MLRRPPRSTRTYTLLPYTTLFRTGLTIAIRYGDQRRQLGPEGGSEVPVLNYRQHQRRLMPLLANAYAFHRSEEHTSELQSLMRISYAVFCLKKKINSCGRLNHIIP